MVQKFCQDHLVPKAQDIDRKNDFPELRVNMMPHILVYKSLVYISKFKSRC